jgi:acyl transferase domain-containing protein
VSSRAALAHRAVVLARDHREALAGLDALAAGEPASNVVPGRVSTAVGVGFVFSGQGSQRVGMGRELYKAFPEFAEAFDEVCELLERAWEEDREAGWLRSSILGEPSSPPADVSDGAAVVLGQVGLFAVEVALVGSLRSFGVEPSAVLGHSVGELTAGYVAGVFSLGDACRLVAARARLMADLPATGAMAALEATEAEAVELVAGVEDRVRVAAVNAPGSVVISGDAETVRRLAERWGAGGRRVRRLRVAQGFHSPLVEPMLEEFSQAAAGVELQEPELVMVSTVTGGVVAEDVASAEHWVEQVRATVRFADAVGAMAAEGVATLLEVGPDGQLAALARTTLDEAERGRGVRCVPLMRADRSELEVFLAGLAQAWARGAPVDWAALCGTGARRVDLPPYPFQHQHYWPNPSPPAPTGAPDEAGFWAAVESGDGERLASELGVRRSASWAEVVPSLARWRRERRDHVRVAGWRYRVEWKPSEDLRIGHDFSDSAAEPPRGQATRAFPLLAPKAPGRSGLSEAPRAGDRRLSGRWLLVTSAGVDGELVGWCSQVMTDHGAAVARLAIASGADRHELAAQITEVAGTQRIDGVLSLVGTDETSLMPAAVERPPEARLPDEVQGGGRSEAAPPTGPRASGVAAGLADTLAVAQALGDLGITAPLWCLTRGAVRTHPSPAASLERGRADRPQVGNEPYGISHVTPSPTARPPSSTANGPAAEPPPLGPRRRDLPVDTLSPVQAQVWGLGRVVGLECPDRWGGLVDLSEVGDDRVAEGLAQVLASSGGEDQAAVRPFGVLVPRLTRAAGGLQAFESAATTPSWTTRGTALVTGGTGALGAHVARWLVAVGAERVILASRGGPEAPGIADLVAELEAAGSRVTVVACDVTDRQALAEVVSSVPATYPLRTVVHMAGVAMDGAVTELDRVDLVEASAAKAVGAWHLHQLTADLDLDAFVLFSSVAAVWGGGDQGAYAAANAFVDALAERRRTEGLPATSVAWGPWAGRGMAEGPAGELLRRRGLRGMTPELAILALHQALDRDETGLVVADVDWERFTPGFTAARRRPLIEDLPEVAQVLVEVEDDLDQHPTELAERLSGLTPVECRSALVEVVRSEVAAVLGHPGSAAVEPDRAFKDLGFDSVTAVELRDRLASVTGLRLPATLVFDHPTPEALAQELVVRWVPAAPLPSDEALDHLARLEAALSSIDTDDDKLAHVETSLRRLLSRLRDGDGADGRGADDRRLEEIRSAADDELLAFIDRQFGA